MLVCAGPSIFKSFFAATQRRCRSRLFRWRRAADGVWIRARTFRSVNRKRSTVFYRTYPHLPDDDFVKEHHNEWLS